jgi:hypothetical protein
MLKTEGWDRSIILPIRATLYRFETPLHSAVLSFSNPRSEGTRYWKILRYLFFGTFCPVSTVSLNYSLETTGISTVD